MSSTRRLLATSVAIVTLSLTALPADALAQRGRGRVLPSRRIAVAPYYYGPVLYNPWFSPYGWHPGSSLRLQVTPRDTEVFVSGYYAGIVDDFDGILQRLHLPPGEHDIQLFLAGHRLVERKIFLQPGGTFRLRHAMEPLQPGDPAPARPSGRPAAPPAGVTP